MKKVIFLLALIACRIPAQAGDLFDYMQRSETNDQLRKLNEAGRQSTNSAWVVVAWREVGAWKNRATMLLQPDTGKTILLEWNKDGDIVGITISQIFPSSKPTPDWRAMPKKYKTPVNP